MTVEKKIFNYSYLFFPWFIDGLFQGKWLFLDRNQRTHRSAGCSHAPAVVELLAGEGAVGSIEGLVGVPVTALRLELPSGDLEGFDRRGESFVGVGWLGIEQVADAHLDVGVGVSDLSKDGR